jgi:hypothetical protein
VALRPLCLVVALSALTGASAAAVVSVAPLLAGEMRQPAAHDFA